MSEPINFPKIPQQPPPPMSKRNKEWVKILVVFGIAPFIIFSVLVAIAVVFDLAANMPSVMSQINSQIAEEDQKK